MWLLYRRTWRGSIFGSFAQPVLFLVAMGIGLGGVREQGEPGRAPSGVPYLQFLAPALLVSTVMQGSAFEATFPVLGGFQWIRRYHAMYATPMGPYAIAFGQIAWIATRATLVASIFCLVILLFGAAPTLGIVLAIPVGTSDGAGLRVADRRVHVDPVRHDTRSTRSGASGSRRCSCSRARSSRSTSCPPRSSGSRGCCRCGTAWRWRARCRSGSCGEDPLINLAHLLILSAHGRGRAGRDVRRTTAGRLER